ncbi:MAG: hypothetical protein WC101_04060 [Candidatus Gracilibacteria bacterium]
MSTPYEGPENRIDPKNKLFTPDQEAARAFGRFEKLDPADRREAIATATFREGDTMRAKLTQYLDQIEGIKTPEQIELVNKVAAQYESSVATWTKLKIPTEGIQTKQEVTAWLNSLPAKTLENLAAYGEVRLKFIPPREALELLEAIKGHSYWDEGWKNVGAKEWEFGLTVDTEDMPQDPKIYYINGVDNKDGTRKNEAMVDLYEQKYQNEGLDIMPQKAAVPSAADALAQGKVLDRKFYTAFKRPEGADVLPNACFANGRVDLLRNDPDSSSGNLRARPWVRGEKV